MLNKQLSSVLFQKNWTVKNIIQQRIWF